ncbi:M48 family metalloprotease [bacterium]|nr:M48 family metalloprotease [bacterium]
MLAPLPKETVYEARERSRRASRRLLLLLVVLYVVFFNMLAFVAALALAVGAPDHGTQVLGAVSRYIARHFWSLNGLLSLCGAFVAFLHYQMARSRELDSLLSIVKAAPADPKDEYHARFINIVHEAEAATGIRPIRAVVLASTGSNTFSMADGEGRAAIGATEGLLSRLDRQELSAVVAHEAAHLVHEDSSLATTVASLTAPFEATAASMKAALEHRPRAYGRHRGGVGLAAFLVWLVASLQVLVMRLLAMALSRGREYMADAAAVRMCKDPLALAEALGKISRRHRGALDIPQSFNSLFILNPDIFRLDEHSGVVAEVFSTHPPIAERIRRLLAWARAELPAGEKSEARAREGPPAPEPRDYYVKKDGEWAGPYTPSQMLALGLLSPRAWIVNPDKEMKRAADEPTLLPLLHERVAGRVAGRACPRCKVSLVAAKYEGAPVLRCAFCHGYLLPAGVLERVLTRDDRAFSREEIETARLWRARAQERDVLLKEGDASLVCPLCQSIMIASFHTQLTRVVVDRCRNPECRALWCDGGELETMQIILAETAREAEGGRQRERP